MKQKYVILPAISMALLLTGCGTNKRNDNNTDRAIRVTDQNNTSETVRATEPIRENHNNRNHDTIIDDAGDVVDDVIDGGRDVVDDVADAGKNVVDDVADAGDNLVSDVEDTNNNNSNR
ncbi:MAG: hypothetical protein K2J88_01000 [Oscillospiraceae bacterium]|nr:hypothetical protein [Oscillospiraceae bacterium]